MFDMVVGIVLVLLVIEHSVFKAKYSKKLLVWWCSKDKEDK